MSRDTVVDMTSDPTEAGDLGGKAPGAILREARLAQNLGVADVARQVKLSVGQVEALESGDFQRLPGPVFVRGFIRNYARLLRIDAEPLLKSVAASLPKEDLLPAAQPVREVPFPTAAPRRWHRYALVLAAIVAALAAYEFFPGGSTPAVREQAAPVLPPVASPQAGPSARSAPETAPEAPAAGPADERNTGTPAAPRASGAVPAAPDAPGAAAKSAAREKEPAPGPGERQVRMVFEKASWVEIRDRSGKAIFSQLNPPGTEQRVNGRPPLAVVVGNPHGVRLTYDERPVNLALHTKVDVARFTLQ